MIETKQLKLVKHNFSAYLIRKSGNLYWVAAFVFHNATFLTSSLLYNPTNTRNMKSLLFTTALCSAFLFSNTATLYAQNSTGKTERKELRKEREKEDAIKNAQKNVATIESLNFSFYPTSYEPEFGMSQALVGVSDFYFTVDKTSFYANMPFLNRFALNANGPANTPLSVSSKSFLYSINSTDGVNIQVTILPNDLSTYFNQGTKFVFYFNKNTNFAKLVVTSEGYQEMTYTGTFN